VVCDEDLVENDECDDHEDSLDEILNHEREKICEK
jgi:hypothetical protein